MMHIDVFRHFGMSCKEIWFVTVNNTIAKEFKVYRFVWNCTPLLYHAISAML